MQYSNELEQSMSIRDAKRSRKQLLALVEDGPVLLTHRRKPVAVAVKYEEWEKIKEQTASREELEQILEKLKTELDKRKGEEGSK